VLFAPITAQDLDQEADPQRQKALEKKRAVQETLQRFVAGALGLLLIRLFALGWQLKRRRRGQQIWIPLAALVVTFALGAAGFFTFEYRYKPLVHMMQLLGGMTTLALLWWIVLREQRLFRSVQVSVARALRPRALFAIALVSAQIVLGGWSMVNYAGLACPDFPVCQGEWWPPMDFFEAFTLWRDVGLDYEGRLLALPAATAIHMAHRIGALMVLLYVGWLALYVVRVGHEQNLCRYGMLVLVVYLAQIGLGLMEVVAHLPLAVAVAHNAFAALLLLALIALYHVLRPARTL
jgi:cytochrome c oxidase assembly protein subunit 15